MRQRKFVIPSAATIAAVFAVVVIAVSQIQSPVSAEELTQQSLHEVSALSYDQRQDLDMRINGDAQAELQAALKAKNLKVLTYSEYLKLVPHAQTMSVHAPGGGDGPTSLDPQSLKYLTYTDSDGTRHVIGVGKDGLPVIVMAFGSTKDGGQWGSVMVTGDGKGTGQGMLTVGGDGSPDPNAPMVGCTQSSGGEVHCTNSDGAAAPNCQTRSDGVTTCSASAQAKQ